MAENIQIATYEHGELKVFGEGENAAEAVLALPLNRMLARVIAIPPERRDDAEAYVKDVMKELSPYPEDELTVGIEYLREDEKGASLVMAAALPESDADDIAAALDAHKLSVTRIDILVLGELRALWPQIGDDSERRRLLVFKTADGYSLLVMDGDLPIAIRSLPLAVGMKLEVTRLLVEAERTGGGRALSEVVLVGFELGEGEELADFAAVRRIARSGEENELALDGIAARCAESESLDALPASWREVLVETRFQAKVKTFVTYGVAVWVLVMAVLFGVPFGYGYMTNHQKALSREHRRQYEAVKSVKEKVSVVRKYSEHDGGALDTLRVVNECLPPLPAEAEDISIELSNWSFKRGESVKFSGEAGKPDLVYVFKDRLVDTGAFARVNLIGPHSKGNRHRFDIECLYETEEAE